MWRKSDRAKVPRDWRVVRAAIILLIAGCEGLPENSDPTILDQPLFGSDQVTKFYLATPTGEVRLRDVVAIAKVLRRYKTLDAAEKELVRLAVARHFEGLIALEARKLAPKYEVERARIQKMPDRKAAFQAREELQNRIRHEAAERVASQLANLVAIPVKAAENRSVVAFAKIDEGQVVVAEAAFEVDAPPGGLVGGAKIALPQGRDGQGVASLSVSKSATATVIETKAVLLNP